MENASTSLYLVPTPIGNLEDITFRAIDILRRVDVVLAEDTRVTGKLLAHYDINKPLKSFHAHNEHKVLEGLIRLMSEGSVLALCSDAGTPGISDPGFLLARACLQHELKIECLPGATAFVPALVKSGLPCERFVFEGFLPHKKGRKSRLEFLSTETRTMVFYESPYRLLKTLNELVDVMGPYRNASVSRELTKIYEETVNGTLQELVNYFGEKAIKGEFVIVVSGIDNK